MRRFGCRPTSYMPLTGSGSGRRYCRLGSEAGTSIGCIGVSRQENDCFIMIDRVLAKAGVKVPEIYGVSADGMAYLQQDLGNQPLFSMLADSAASEFVEETLKSLVKVQRTGGLEGRLPVMDMDLYLADMRYFQYCFLKPAGIVADDVALERDFQKFSRKMIEEQPVGNMYRDCQSRNVMIHGGHPWWIDFQSMRTGPVLYDVASFLWQARAGFSAEFRKKMADMYIREYNAAAGEASVSAGLLDDMVLFRTLQVLGAYGLRGLTERKSHFIESIPAALDNVHALLRNGAADGYPALKAALEAAAELERFRKDAGDGRLTVRVFSFSYKLGYPEDLTGNGGGFMFDCRALHNPGRYDRFKPLTGRDLPVIGFLEERGEIQPFLKSAWDMTDPAIERYVKRGFSSLQIGFGCTGGRHRSVYSAERTAHHIARKYGDDVRVVLEHREQGIMEVLS